MNLRRSLLPVVAFLAVAGADRPLAGQVTVPTPLPLSEVAVPEFTQTRLANGIELIVVEHREQPFISVNLVVPGGAVADPAGREGAAEMVANLLARGTLNRSASQVAEAIDRMGATLEGAVGLDWSTVGLEVLTPSLDAALLLMADVVLSPRFAADEIELLRNQMLQGLRLAESNPAALASRQFVREVFRDHPYGRLATEESVRAISREDLVGYHDQFFNAEGAVFVVAGDVSMETAAASISRAFGGWTGTAARRPVLPAVPAPSSREIVLVDLPGSLQASMIVGGAFEPVGRDEARWVALEVMTEVLGGAGSGRLFRTLREDRGWTYAVEAEAGRRIGPGLFRVDALVREAAVDSALTEVIAQLERVRVEEIDGDELDDVKTFLAGSFPLQLETPQQLAAQLLRYRLLGLDPESLDRYRAEVRTVDGARAREAARHAIDPSRAIVVVVGDAARLASKMSGLGSIRVVEPDGSDRTPDPAPEFIGPPPPPRVEARDFNVRALPEGRWEYDVRSRGRVLGEMVREITRTDGPEGEVITVRSGMELGPLGHSRQTVAFTAEGFRPVATTIDKLLGGVETKVSLRVAGDTLLGSITGPDGAPEAFAALIPAGAVIGEMQEVALWVTDLGATPGLSVRVMGQGDGEVRSMDARVLGATEITVPAGTFDVWEVEFELAGPPQRAYLTRAAPHLLVRLGAEAAPVTVELRSSTRR